MRPSTLLTVVCAGLVTQGNLASAVAVPSQPSGFTADLGAGSTGTSVGTSNRGQTVASRDLATNNLDARDPTAVMLYARDLTWKDVAISMASLKLVEVVGKEVKKWTWDKVSDDTKKALMDKTGASKVFDPIYTVVVKYCELRDKKPPSKEKVQEDTVEAAKTGKAITEQAINTAASCA